ncbi:hypothetical protein Cni_G12936 [Canna indica]|uniref:Reverse transcriptase domain-containing protein n=1 Tax=Canna indica TaxID=4628 RepID=A0AAQ3QD97_9LILI|nr:hypothetical protein Cni_G12936 [Canna indica]
MRENLKRLSVELEKCNREIIGNLERRWKEASAKLAELESKEEKEGLSDEEMCYLRLLNNKVVALSRQIQLKWWSKSRRKWIEGGDKNSKKFHNIVKLKRRNNRTAEIEIGARIIKDEGQMAEEFAVFYGNLWKDKDRGSSQLQRLEKYKWNTISEAYRRRLCIQISVEEVWNAMVGFGRGKSPGVDGYIVEFYIQHWEHMKCAVIKEVNSVFKNNIMPAGWNNTKLVMIPKHEKSRKIQEFRPIAVCNTIYKIVAKIIANRIRSVLDKIISKEQMAFVPKRHIQDNVLVVTKMVNSFYKSKASKPYILLKLDLEKTYDRVECSMPSYALSTSWVSENVVKKISKSARNFFWGGDNNRRSARLINWSRVTACRSVGGLGTGDIVAVRKIAFAKRIFSILNEEDHLWVEVLKQKYGDWHPWMEVGVWKGS